MFCEHCGRKLPDDAKFCGGCGMAVTPIVAPRETGSQGAYGMPAYGAKPLGAPEQKPQVVHGARPQDTAGPRPRDPYRAPEAQMRKPAPHPAKKREKGRGGLVALLVGGIAVAAALIVMFLLPKLIPGFHMPWQKPEPVASVTPTPTPTAAPTEEPAKPVDPSKTYDIDGVALDRVNLEGTYMAVAGTEGFLQFPTAKTLLAYDENGEPCAMENVYSILVYPSETVSAELLDTCSAMQIRVNGPVRVNDKREPYVEAAEIATSAGLPIEAPEDVAAPTEQAASEAVSEAEEETEAAASEIHPLDAEAGIHIYDYIIEDCTWTEAFQKAKAAGGYLARINTQEEFDYIVRDLNKLGMSANYFYLGGRRPPNGDWYSWVDSNDELMGDRERTVGAGWTTSPWLANEPSYMDNGVEEAYLEMFFMKSEDRWVWNDVPNDVIAAADYFKGKMGYIIEYE